MDMNLDVLLSLQEGLQGRWSEAWSTAWADGALRDWTVSALRITLIIGLAWVASVLLRRAISGFRERVTSRLHGAESIQRAQTLGRVFRYLAAVLVWAAAAMLVLTEVGISVAPLLGAAGVAGIAVGFGAQNLVRDYFTGFVLLLEDQIRQGDVVRLGEHAGLVEEVTLRHVRLRDYDGHVHFVPNGQISSVVNMSRGFAQAVIDVPVARDEDPDRVLGLMRQVAEDMARDPAQSVRLLDPFEPVGVERWDQWALVVRGRLRVAPLQQWTVRREYLRRLTRVFAAHGVRLPACGPWIARDPRGLAA